MPKTEFLYQLMPIIIKVKTLITYYTAIPRLVDTTPTAVSLVSTVKLFTEVLTSDSEKREGSEVVHQSSLPLTDIPVQAHCY